MTVLTGDWEQRKQRTRGRTRCIIAQLTSGIEAIFGAYQLNGEREQLPPTFNISFVSASQTL